MTSKCQCGCGLSPKSEKSKFLPGHFIRTKENNRENNYSWKGGKYNNYSGYAMVNMPGHERAQYNGYVREHIIITENALGKKLPEGSQVHHCGDPSDNSQLVICEDQNYHFFLHIRARALRECGDANKRKCKFCNKYDFPENMHCVQSKKGHGWNVYHLKCARIYDKKRYHKRRNR